MSSYPIAGLPLHLIMPLLSGVIYVIGALLLKRASVSGADMWRTSRICNYATALFFVPLLLLGGTVPSWNLVWQPAIVGLLFVAGQVAMLLSLHIGDVSVATPVLGLKILLVALLTTVLNGDRFGPGLWTAAFLSTGAIVLLNLSRSHSHHRVGSTILMSAGAASAYALFDVLVQKWSPAWGAGRFLPLTMGFVAAYSVFLRPVGAGKRSVEVSTSASRWVLSGSACFGVQAMMFVTSIGLYGQATVANVLYSSRGLWSVVAVWLIGHWFGNRERQHGTRVFAWRLIGAALLMAAILIVLLG